MYPLLLLSLAILSVVAIRQAFVPSVLALGLAQGTLVAEAAAACAPAPVAAVLSIRVLSNRLEACHEFPVVLDVHAAAAADVDVRPATGAAPGGPSVVRRRGARPGCRLLLR